MKIDYYHKKLSRIGTIISPSRFSRVFLQKSTMRHFKKIIYLFSILCLASQTVFAQSSEGTDFWFSFMEHRDNSASTMVVMITSKTNTSGTISMPLTGFLEDFTVQANQVKLITMPNNAEVQGSEFEQDKGIHLTTENPVTVYLHHYHPYRSEATLVLPTNALGKDYYVMTYEGIENQSGIFRSEFLMVAVEDETTLTVEVSDETKEGNDIGDVFTLVLNQGEVYQVQGLKGTSDLSGSHITSDKPLAVFAGSEWSEVPLGCSARDNLIEMLYPVETWGQSFIGLPFEGSNASRYRVMASETATTVTMQGSPALADLTLNPGEFHEFSTSNPVFFSADKPILVAQYILGMSCSGASNGDPSMVLLNSIEQTRDTVTLYNSSLENIEENYINIVFITDDAPFITLDGTSIESLTTVQTVTGNENFAYATVAVNAGSHTIISEGCGVIATCYGLGEAESYAYSGGASFSPINANPIADGSCLNEEVLFDVGLSEGRYAVQWDLGDGTQSEELVFTHTYPDLGNYPVELIIFDECLNTFDTLNRNFAVTLRQEVAALDVITACEEESFTLEATDVSSATYEWTGPNNFFSEEQFPSFNNSNPSLSGNYEVVGIVSGCRTFPATTMVEIFPTPTLDLGTEQFFCPEEEEVILDAGFFDGYLWSTGATGNELRIEAGGVYGVTVTDANGCTNMDSTQVTEICPTFIYVPNVFSPNFDGINDYFEIQGRNILKSEISIYDRWGSLIFQTNEINARWDGTLDGQNLPSGVYVYVIEIEGYNQQAEVYNKLLKGDVQILR